MVQEFGNKRVVIRFEFEEFEQQTIFNQDKGLFLLDVSSLLYDFVLLHDVVTLSLIDDYRKYLMIPFFNYRTFRSVPRLEHRPKLIRISHESPLLLEIAVPTVIVVGLMIALMKLAGEFLDWPLRREKLQAELEKAKEEARKAKIDRYISEIEVRNIIEQREISQRLNSIRKRLLKNPLKLKDINVEEEDKESKQNS